MKRLLICQIFALLQLSFGLPLEGSVKTVSVTNSAIDGPKLDAAGYSQAQVSGQSAEGPQVVNGGHATSGGQQTSGVAQAAPPGVAQNLFSGQTAVGTPFQLSGLIANPTSGNTQSVGEAQDPGRAQTAGGAQANGEAQALNPGRVVAGGQASTGGAQGQVSGQGPGSAPVQILGQVGGVQPAGETQANANPQSQLSVKAVGTLHPQISKPSAGGAQAVGEAQAADRVMQAGAQAPDGNQVFGVGQFDVSGQPNGVAQSPISETSFGEAQSVGSEQAAGRSQPNGEAQDLQEAASNQASVGAAQEGPLSLSPSIQQSQEGMQESKNEPPSSQISKQSQQQIIGGAVPSNLSINESGPVGQTNANSRAQAGVGMTA